MEPNFSIFQRGDIVWRYDKNSGEWEYGRALREGHRLKVLEN